MFLAETLIWYLKNFVFRAYELRSGIVVLVMLLYAAAAAVFVWRLCCLRGKAKARRKRLRLALGLLWAALGLWSLLPHTDARTKTAEPELVATIPGEAGMYGWIYYIYEIHRWPFSYDSVTAGYQSVPVKLEEILPYVQQPEEYTYIISFGQPLRAVRWNIWDSWTVAPPPWNGRVMEPDEEPAGPLDENIYVYRVPGVYLQPYS